MALSSVAFGLDAAFTGSFLIESFIPKEDVPVAQIGIGSRALGKDVAALDSTMGGIIPTVQLFDTHGENFANFFGGDAIEAAVNKKVEFEGFGTKPFLPGDFLTREPVYMRIQAHDLQRDPVCVSYVTVTAVSGSHRAWHAGYARQCDAGLWYPSPELFPRTNFAPGCIWLSNHDNDRFLQAVSVKLTDFAFPETREADLAQAQYTAEPATLCKAPGRMAFWERMNVLDCVPFYDFPDSEVRAAKDDAEARFLDKDLLRVINGHTVPCEWQKTTTLKNDKLDFPMPLVNPSSGGFGGVAGLQGTPCPEGSFGGVCGVQFGDVNAGGVQTDTDTGSGSAGGDEIGIPVPDSEKAPPVDGQGSGTDGQGAGSSGGDPPFILPTPGVTSPNVDDGTGSDTGSDAGSDTGSGSDSGTGSSGSPPPPPPQVQAGSKGATIIGINPGGSDADAGFQPPPPAKSRRARRDALIRSALERRAELASQGDLCVDALTISEHEFHARAASEVCGSETSWGPDFVSTPECAYCDMCTRVVWKVCGCGEAGAGGEGQAKVVEGADGEEYYCFDLEKRELRVPPNLQSRELGQLKKVYRRVDHWK